MEFKKDKIKLTNEFITEALAEPNVQFTAFIVIKLIVITTSHSLMLNQIAEILRFKHKYALFNHYVNITY